jgi:catechol-2,3-dioxygenase
MLTNIRPTNNPVEITGIGGTKIRVNHIGDLLGYGSVYFHPDVSANIISFHHLAKRFKSVTYNNRIKDAFIVTRDDDSTMEFVPPAEGLYHYDFNLSVKRRKELESLIKETAMIIQTVDGIKRIFLKKEIENADKARRLHVTVRRPSQKIFEEMIRRGKLFNANITTQDYRNALQMYGKDLGVKKARQQGKTRSYTNCHV